MVRRKPRRKPLGTIWEISDELWRRIEPILLEFSAQETDWAEGRQLAENAECDHLPAAQRLPVGPTARAVRTQEHCPRLVPALGCSRNFERIWAVLVAECDELGGVQWEWQPADAMLGKPLRGEKDGQESHRPGKRAPKRAW